MDVNTSKINHNEVLAKVVEAEMEHYIEELNRKNKNKELEDVKLKWNIAFLFCFLRIFVVNILP